MAKKGLATILSAFVLCFYIFIIMYVFFAIMHINTLENFVSAMVFEIIGFGLLFFFIIGSLLTSKIKIGFLVPILLVTVVYTILLDVLNIAFITSMPHVYFVLINLLLLFVYCVITIPMYVMGKNM